MPKHSLECVSVVISANLHNLPCICIKTAPTSTFFTFLALVGIKVGKRKLRTWQNMVWKALCCLVIPANLQKICGVYASKWLRRVVFSTFPMFVGIHKMNKGSLEHDNTWFGRRFCCLVIYATVFTMYPVYASKWLRQVPFFTFL